MRSKSFAPQLIANEEIDITQLTYPLLISTKMDGIRLIIKDGQLLTRSLKPLPNIQLNQKFEPIRKFTEERSVCFDGEIFAPNIPFQFIVSAVMTENYEDKKSIKKWTELCQEHDCFISRQEVFDKLKFYCFDSIENEQPNTHFKQRSEFATLCMMRFPNIAFPVEQIEVNDSDEVIKMFEIVLNDGFEGLIIRSAKAPYKYGRTRLSENNSYKLKPWATTDSKIIGIVQATEVNEDAEKTTTELGMSRTSKKQEDRHLIDKANAFVVDYEGKELNVPIALTAPEKKYIWSHQSEYIGKYVEYKFMRVGMKDLPRIPRMVRMRLDRD